MKRIILSKVENDLLIHCLEELVKNSSDIEIVDQKWMDRLDPVRKLFNLELSYYKIRSDQQPPTKKQMVEWLLIKIKNKTADL